MTEMALCRVELVHNCGGHDMSTYINSSTCSNIEIDIFSIRSHYHTSYFILNIRTS